MRIAVHPPNTAPFAGRTPLGGDRIISNHNEMVLKVRKGFIAKHNETALKVQ